MDVNGCACYPAEDEQSEEAIQVDSEEVRTSRDLPWALEVHCQALEGPKVTALPVEVAAKLRIGGAEDLGCPLSMSVGCAMAVLAAVLASVL